MEVLKLINIKTPVIKLKTLSDGSLALLDSNTTLRILNPDDYRVIAGFKSNIIHERISNYVVDISSSSDFSISTLPQSNQAAVFSTHKKELVYKLGRHQGEIESVAIDPNSRYCVTCGQDGKVFIWALKTSKLIFSMPAHTDFVTSVAFNAKGQWIATGSFDKTINVLNLGVMKNSKKLIGHSSVIISIEFLSDTLMVSSDKDGGIILWDISSGKLLKRLPKMNDTITTMCVSDDKRFLFVGSKLGYVALYDMQSMDIIKQKYLKESEEISSMAYLDSESRLAIGTIQGNIRFYSIYGDQAYQIELLRTHNYKAYYSKLDENPMIQYSKSYQLAEKLWKDILSKAKINLEKGNRTKAKELFDLYSGVQQKNSIINYVLQNYEKFSQFESHIKEERYSSAYSIAKQYPMFQDSESYRKMEERWKKVFFKAQELILTPTGGEERARAILAPYRGVSEKSILIQQLFTEKRLYEYFKSVIASRNFIKFFDLIKNQPFLKEFSEYKLVMDYADKLYIQGMKAYQDNDLATAKKCFEILIPFPDFSKEAIEIVDDIKIKFLFKDAIAAENYINAFNYLASYPMLYDTKLGKQLELQWNKTVDLAFRFAIKGDIEALKKQFEFYLPINSKHAAMGALFAQAYSTQLEQKFRDKVDATVLENGIRNYIGMFGIDEFILHFSMQYKQAYKSNLDIQVLKKGSLDTWMPSMLLLDITSKKS